MQVFGADPLQSEHYGRTRVGGFEMVSHISMKVNLVIDLCVSLVAKLR